MLLALTSLLLLQGTAADPEKAKSLWQKACKNGDGEEKACKKIGVPMKD